MRLVQVLIPEGDRASVLGALDKKEIDYAVWEETGRGDFEALVSFPVPEAGVEPVLDELYAAGIREDAYTVIMPTETIVSEQIETLKNRFGGYRISREELTARAEDLAPTTSTFFIFNIISAIIATTGLLLNSVATIIGAMVIAPLMGPAISTSVGAVFADRDMTSRGITLQITGLLSAVTAAAIFGLLLKETALLPPTELRSVPQITERTVPSFLSLFLALGSGVAGAISVMRSEGSALVGVAIAVALIPPAAASGLGLAWGQPEIAFAAGVLVVVNLLAINLSAHILFWAAGYQPQEKEYKDQALRTVRTHIVIVIVAIVLLSVALGTVTWASFVSGDLNYRANTEIKESFDSGQFDPLVFGSVSIDYSTDDVLLNNQAEVTITAEHFKEGPVPPNVAQRIDGRLTRETGENIVVNVDIIRGQNSA